MSKIDAKKPKKHMKIIFSSATMSHQLDSLLKSDNLFEKGLCVRKIPGKREIWQVSMPGETYYIKIFFNNLLRKLRFFLGLSKAQKELMASQILKDKDIPVADIIAYGVEKSNIFEQKEWLVIREIEGEKLKDFVFNKFFKLSKKKQKKIINDFSLYIRKLHDNGVLHKDPNLGNFLIRQKGDENFFYLLDLSDVIIKPFLSIDERFNNLSLLNLNFHKWMPKSLRFFFFKNYSQGLFNKTDMIRAINTIEAQTLNLSKKALAKKIKLCFKSNKLFNISKKGNLKIYMKKAWKENKNIDKLLSFPDAFLDGGKGTILKDGNTVKAARLSIDDGKWMFLKRYNKKGWFHTIKNIFRISRARRVWKVSWTFELYGIPIPSAIAYMEDRKFCILNRSYILSDYLDDVITLSSFFKKYSAINYPDKSIEVMQLLGREIGKMHKFGCIHGDLKWSNILLKELDDKYKCFFVDLDGSRIKKRLSLSEIIDELSRFYIEMLKYKLNSKEQEVFFQSYYKCSGLEIPYERVVSMVKERTIRFRHINI